MQSNRSDEDIKKDIVDQLYWDERVDASNVNVQVHEGIVMLSGVVPSYVAHEAAAAGARAVRGVRDVRLQLTIHDPLEVTAPADENVKANVETVLRAVHELSTAPIDVFVDAGQVTLSGTVDSYWKKSYARDVAARVRSVRSVENTLTVVPTQNILDRVIAENIMAALSRNHLVAPDSIDVEVKNGRVNLTGTARSWAARYAAYSAALHTPGVKDVQEDVLVEP